MSVKKKLVPRGFKKLRSEFKSVLDAEKVLFEPIPGSRRFRVIVVSSKFKKMPQLKRQDRIWTVVNSVLDPEASLRISLILAFAPNEWRA
jgi:acid stress-induced BolA-like protein IbaG/YrbA